MKLLLLNGPPRAGKDTIAKEIHTSFGGIGFERFSQPLKAMFAVVTNTTMNEYFENTVYEDKKEEVIPWLGVSYRQFQIDTSENFLKKLYGDDIFGKLFVERLEGYRDYDLVVVPDSGFDIEIEVLEKNPPIPLEDILLIRMRREGFDFKNDSRNYVYPKKIKSYDYQNVDLETTELIARCIAKAFIEDQNMDDFFTFSNI